MTPDHDQATIDWQIDELLTHVESALLSNVPRYQAVSRIELRTNLRRLIRWLFEEPEGSDGDRALPEWLTQAFTHRALSGFTLAELWEAVRAGTGAARAHVFSVWRSLEPGSGEARACERAIESICELEHGLLLVAEAGMRGLRDRRSAEEARGRDARLAALLDHELPASAGPGDTVFEPGLVPPYGVVVLADVTAMAADADLLGRATEVLRPLGSRVIGPIAQDLAFLEPGLRAAVALVALAGVDTDADEWGERCARLGVVLVHDTAATLRDVRRTFQRLGRSLPAARRCTRQVGWCVTPDDLLMHRMADGLALSEQEYLLGRYVAPVAAQPNREKGRRQIDVIRASMGPGSVGDIARAVHASPNTVRNDVAAIAGLTGLEVGAHRMGFSMALVLFDLYESELPPLGDPRWQSWLRSPGSAPLRLLAADEAESPFRP